MINLFLFQEYNELMLLHPKTQRDFASPRSPLPILLNQFPISISIDPHRVNFKSISISSSQPRFLRIASFSIQSESRHKSSSRSLLHFFLFQFKSSSSDVLGKTSELCQRKHSPIVLSSSPSS